MMIKTYSELMGFKTFKERYEYLRLKGIVGEETYGYDRFINQEFYHSKEWRNFRNKIIIRDNGCDLGIEDRPIRGKVLIHHINPIGLKDLINGTDVLMDEENVICVSHMTHEAIHYGDSNLLMEDYKPRFSGDTTLWR